MRLTFFTDEAEPICGTGTVTHDLACALATRRDIQFEILANQGASRPSGPASNGRVAYTLPRWTPTFRLRPHKFLPILFGKVRMAPTDLIHAVVEFPYAILAERLARRLGVPFVVSVHGTYAVTPFAHWENRALYRRAIRRAAAITACSEFIAGALRNASGIDRDIEVVGNPVDYARYQRPCDLRAARERFGLPGDSRIIFSAGGLKARKGFDVLIRAFARLSREAPRTVLAIAGGGDPRPYRELAVSRGVGPRVKFLGALAGDAMVAAYQLCDAFALLPRFIRGNSEAFGLVYLEAGACGKPVLGTRTGGVPEAVREGETGLLVDEGDEVGAAQALRRLISDPAYAKSLGEAGRRWAAGHDRQIFADRMVRIYRRVLGRERSVLRSVHTESNVVPMEHAR